MTQRSISLVLGVILALLFGSLFLMQFRTFYLSEPAFPKQIEQVMNQARQHHWERAEAGVGQVGRTWRKGKVFLAIKYADENYARLNVSLMRLKSAVATRNVHEVVSAGESSILLFEEITSISPEI